MDLTLVIPVKEEAENLPELFEEIVSVLDPLSLKYEVICIDDGSRDNTWDVLSTLVSRYAFLQAYRFQFNCGKAAALSLGFSKAKGEYVVTLDGDLQDDPHEIPKMIKILEEGYDLVSGWKIRRLDPWHKTWPSKLFNLTVSAVCGKRLHDFNCGIKAYRRFVVQHISLYGDYHRFIPVMAKWKGFRITEMPVAHRARQHGVSKYGVSRLISGFLDLISLVFMQKFAGKPLHFFGVLGFLFILIGSIIGFYFGVEWIQTGELHVRPLLLLAGFSAVMGVQFISLGLIAEMVNGQKQIQYPITEILGEDKNEA